jgi:hypothetical protein
MGLSSEFSPVRLLRIFRSENRFHNVQLRSKRRKVRGHRAIAPFSDVGRIVDDHVPFEG